MRPRTFQLLVGCFRLLLHVPRVLPGRHHGRPDFDELERWASDASDRELLDALADPDHYRRGHALRELCGREPERAVGPIVASARQRVGNDVQSDEPPDAKELVELGLAFGDCQGLRAVELLTDFLADTAQDPGLRVRAAIALGSHEDPRAMAALKAATHDSNRLVRQIALTMLAAREAFGER